MSELACLLGLLFVAFILGPLMTWRFLLGHSRLYAQGFWVSVSILSLGFLLKVHELVIVWPLFCLFGLVLYVKLELKLELKLALKNLFIPEKIVGMIPLVFSVIAAVWLFAGANDLFLLGYDQKWSYYASLHGNYLGWLFVCCLVAISKALGKPVGHLFIGGGVLCFVFFLLIAFGIDGYPALKPIGVMGITLVVPVLVGRYLFSLRRSKSISFYLAGVSFLTVVLTMALALFYELGWLGFFVFLNLPFMVSLHGVLNALVVIPSLCLAVWFDNRQQKTEN